MGRRKSAAPLQTRACFCNATKCSEECGIGRIVAIPNGDIRRLGWSSALSRGMTKVLNQLLGFRSGSVGGGGQNRAFSSGAPIFGIVHL